MELLDEKRITPERVVAAYRATGATCIRGVWHVELALAGHCYCPAGVLLIHEQGWTAEQLEQADVWDIASALEVPQSYLRGFTHAFDRRLEDDEDGQPPAYDVGVEDAAYVLGALGSNEITIFEGDAGTDY